MKKRMKERSFSVSLFFPSLSPSLFVVQLRNKATTTAIVLLFDFILTIQSVGVLVFAPEGGSKNALQIKNLKKVLFFRSFVFAVFLSLFLPYLSRRRLRRLCCEVSNQLSSRSSVRGGLRRRCRLRRGLRLPPHLGVCRRRRPPRRGRVAFREVFLVAGQDRVPQPEVEHRAGGRGLVGRDHVPGVGDGSDGEPAAAPQRAAADAVVGSSR